VAGDARAFGTQNGGEGTGVTSAGYEVHVRPAGCHVIALGRMGNNALLERLYYSCYVAVDAANPGRGRHVLQTVCDPWGDGGNVGADVNGDGRPEMICGAKDSCAYAFSGEGELLYRRHLGQKKPARCWRSSAFLG